MTVSSGRELVEDNDLSAAPVGMGTYLAGTFGIAPADQATSLDFVQLYIPIGAAPVTYALEASESGVGKTVLTGEVPVPEPGMLCLLGLGSLAMLLIRRR